MGKILVIGGIDSSGGAGLSADSETIHSLGRHSVLCPSAITIQGKKSPFKSYDLPPSMIESQLDSIEESQIDGIKIGMLPNKESVEIVASFIEGISCANVILDPVLTTSLGESLCTEEGIDSLKEILFPLVTLITPNLNEANSLTDESCSDFEDFPKLAEKCLSYGTEAVLIKGGHLNDIKRCKDYLLFKDKNYKSFDHRRIVSGSEVRGTGCRLASAITCKFVSINSLTTAVGEAIDFVGSYISRKATQSIC